MDEPDPRAGSPSTPDPGGSFEAYLTVAFDLAPVPLLLVDADDVVRRTNRMAAQESTSDDPIGRPLVDAGFDPPRIGYLPSPSIGSTGAGAGPLRLVRLADPDGETVTTDTVGNLVRQIAESLPDISTILYDVDLRVVAAGGRPLHRAGFDAGAMVGRPLVDILGQSRPDLEPRLRAALAGRESTIQFLSPVNGLEYGITCRPIRGSGDRVIAGLMTNQEVTEDLRRRSQLAEIQRLSQVGSATYDRIRGWTIDPELLALFGVDTLDGISTAWDTLVLEPDRPAVRAAFDSVLKAGGRASVRYRVRRPDTNEIRDAQGGFMAAVDAAGGLVRAVITHVDVTAALSGERLRAKAAHDRTQLLRRVSDLLAQGGGDRIGSVQRIADLASATIGGDTLVRVVTLEDGAPDLNLLSDPAPEPPAGDRTADPDPDTDTDTDTDTPVAEADAVRRSVRAWIPPPSRLDPGDPSAQLYSSIGNPGWREEYRRQTGHPVHPQVAHFISAPVRHDGRVLGFVRAFRLDAQQPFEAGEDDLLQVIADRIGTVLGADLVRTLLERQYDQGRSMEQAIRRLTSDQRDLLEQLTRVEERERLMLAEAIHDGPMQLVVAAAMRVDALAVTADRHAAELNDVAEVLEESVTTLRTLITALTPPGMNDNLDRSLRLTLQHLAEAVFVLDDGVTIEVTGPDQVALSRLRKMNLLRIMREALTNARKHARAGHIRLRLTQDGGTVIATLSDDGIGATGFDAGPGHLGMATMRGRAAAEGGSLDVSSAPGLGTTVTLRLPVDGDPRPGSTATPRPGTR